MLIRYARANILLVVDLSKGIYSLLKLSHLLQIQCIAKLESATSPTLFCVSSSRLYTITALNLLKRTFVRSCAMHLLFSLMTTQVVAPEEPVM